MEPLPKNPFRDVIGATSNLALKEDRTALIVVDMQYFDAHPAWGEGLRAQRLGVLEAFDEYFEMLHEAVPRIQSLQSLCRQKGIEIIHVRIAELTEDSRDVGWKYVVRGLAVPRNSKEAELLEEVAPVGDEIVISKSSSSAFATTNLDRILRNMGMNTLIFTGTATGGCIESSARDGADLGYEVWVVSDACADSTRLAHRLALARMAGGYVLVVSTDGVQSALAHLPPVNREARSGVARANRYVPTRVSKSASRQNPFSLIYPPPIDLPIEPSSSALVVVDVQYLTCDPGLGLGRLAREQGWSTALESYYVRVREAIPNLRLLVDKCRSVGVMIVYVRTAAHTSDGRDLNPQLRRLAMMATSGSREICILDEVAPQPGDVLLNKPASGVCTGTGLDDLLRNAGVRTVILAGVSFNGAIEGSIRSLFDRGYGLVLVPDACATFDEVLQRSLWDVQAGTMNVVPTEELAGRLSAAHLVKSGQSR